jgi:lipopolysaccharide transport system ATP-binding protein
MAAKALEVEHLTKTFKLHRDKTNSIKGLIAKRGKRNVYEEFVALDDISFDVKEGEMFGVIGHNGSGKSTLLKCMAGILQPNKGRVAVEKRMSALLELGAGFHPELSGRDNVFLNAAILGMGRRDIAARFDEIVEFAGIGDFIESPVKTYSSGMYIRLAFAIAVHVEPKLLIVDEILAVGDVTFQQKCLEKFVDFRNEGRTIVLVTHDMGSVRNMCDRAIWLTHGKMTGEGDPADLVTEYVATMLGDRVEGATSTRRGSGEIQVTDVELMIGDGSVPTRRFRTGDDVRLRLHYRTSTRVARPVFGFVIERTGSVAVTAPHTRDAGVVPESLDGTGVVEVCLSNIALLPGSYDLHANITDFNRQHVYDNLQLALRFDVMTGTTLETGGAVTLRPRWSIG